jgi:hypothetical protein
MSNGGRATPIRRHGEAPGPLEAPLLVGRRDPQQQRSRSRPQGLHPPRAIALSLKRSAERSKRRKATPYQSAMSMLTFYINRAGQALPARQRDVLERAKTELRKAFGRV